MTTPTEAETAAAFAALADLVYQGASFADVYAAVCRTAVSIVPGCDHACVTTISAGRRAECEGPTDEVARRFDDIEWDVMEGPCVDAIRTERFELDPDITSHAAWPRLAERVLAELPVRGMLGYRIVTGEHKVAALNLLSDTPGALTQDSAALGAILAAFASVVLTAAAERQTAASLRNALDNSREIGKAIGILMATYEIGDDEAFEMLRSASNKLNVRLSELAQRVLDDHDKSRSRRA